MNENMIIYNACGYVRASKEDRDKSESNTIVNQKAMIEAFAAKHPEIHLKAIKKDDGESGVSFDRPGFQEMMGMVESGIINCVIVKDLSRLGRNWLEAGQYIHQQFPMYNVRFIAINDNYDSIDCNADESEVMVPFKNLMNESYARDASIKTRSVFETKRRAGEFIGSFVPYGYKRADEDKHKLVIDEYPAGIVRDIFAWKIEGMSAGKIAEKLNTLGILSPMEYKSSVGTKYATSFKNKTKAEWNAVSVGRILKNEVYIGCLVQGKRGSVNYKVKKVEYKAESEWTRIENTHEAIIDRKDFEIVQNILKFDTRSSPNKENVYLFSGVIFCGDCKQNMIRKTAYAKDKKYYYYICSSHKDNTKFCSTHNFSENKLASIVLQAIRKQIEEMTELSEILEHISVLPAQQIKVRRIQAEIETIKANIDKTERRKKRLYDDCADGILMQDDFRMMNNAYTEEIQKYKSAMEMRNAEMRTAMDSTTGTQWIETFTKQGNVEELDRRLIVTLIDKIFIYEDNKIEILFKYSDKYMEIMSFIKEAEMKREVV